MFFRSFTVIIRAGQGLAPLSRFGLACASTSYGVCVCGATFFWIAFSLTAAAISGSLPAGLTLQLRSRFPSNPLFLYLSVSPPSLRLHYNAYALVCQCICVVYLQKNHPIKPDIWFFVKFWGAKVSMHSWRGHALNTVRVLFRCVC